MNFKKYFIVCSLIAFSFQINAQEFGWGGSFGGNGEDVIKATHVDSEGNVYTTGYFTDTANFDINGSFELTSNGFYDAFVQKTDSQGNFLWAKNFGSEMFEHGGAITADDAGNVYITGNYEGTVDFDPEGAGFEITSAGAQDIFILKLDSNGDFVWAKSVGGVDFEEALSIVYSPNGQVILSGFFYEPIDLDPGVDEFIMTSEGLSDTFILRLDEDGDFISAQQYGGTGMDLAIDMTVNAAGDLFITGYFTDAADMDPDAVEEYILTATGSGFAGYVLHLNNAGEFVKAGITHGGETFNNGIAVDQMDNIYVSGYFSGTVNFNHDPNGTPINYTSATQYNGFVMKVDPFGNVAWAKHLECNDFLMGYDVDVTGEGEVVSVGFFTDTADFDPSSGEFSLTHQSGNATDAYLSILDTDGNFINAFQFGGVNFMDANSVGVDAQNNIYTAAHFETTVDLNPLPDDELPTVAVDFRDNYIIKLLNGSLSNPDVTGPQLSVYPNPASDKVYVKGLSREIAQEYQLTDVKGRLLRSGSMGPDQSIDVSTLETGLYFIKVAESNPVKLLIR
ncbi:T9SS type A sorting domain-containing protein [Planktosalinus lacus]|uniref:Secretion system C-terminal sorting domain-containing protein n=1 Tax=Planktosalinus lacus TaxID=1526573 RepID=A0A8J2YAA1_9FLAO|nr:T9SS type A sorting domain-containing protein [Planktosalinus lacus]GGD96802.1 hypothetical protein GCM10011312_20410 [Planktosalinus lacus]